MNILIIGSGGREHAIGRQLAESPQAPTLFFAPGNPGMEDLGQRLDIDVSDIQGLKLFAEREHIDLTVVGPENPLSDGIVDTFQKAELTIFGPSQAGAMLESSKNYAKNLMDKAGIPTASFTYCATEPEAVSALSDFSAPFVIKEDGLAAGKGVTIAQNKDEAIQAIRHSFEKQMPVVIETFMQGEELSILCICDGTHAIPMISAQDFKKAHEGNTGPNTGGMGAYAPVPFVTDTLMTVIQNQVLTPMMNTLKAEGIDYRGVLYAGLMIDRSQPIDASLRVVEFNVRFGDPETQVVLPLLQDDFIDILMASAKGDLSAYKKTGFRFTENQSAVTVVLASKGYPGAYETGISIQIPNTPPESSILFHAGTKHTPTNELQTKGGRVMSATGLGHSLPEAAKRAYTLANRVQFEGKTLRRDIAKNVDVPTPTTC